MTITDQTADLLRQQTKAVDAGLREIIAARGVDPDDRSPGWEDRCRAVLADLEWHESVEWLGDYRARIVTTIRPAQRDH